ncbi:hypothetical protein [Natronohydrobacter thiooxidans]|jgi:hypothetical protein|uniref:hypothetical protein n=1 Tax=Natronohydrobacter thiooxidans TaxID=87172 RepID=UPI000AABB81B|nr:hypothetical protein [Natronohydrobacter thiooxidans]
MKAFLAAIIFAGVLAFGAATVLDGSYQQPSYSAFTTEGARVDNPGHNLIGN